MKLFIRLISIAISCALLNGCVVAAAADLAATTVLTVGKVAVKGTGAVVRAAIPDGDDEEKEEDKKRKK
ncbi:MULTISPECIES: NF038104 family lipoprotein [unclassified Neisseria]|uniref:NF038104 family lipoprotein n=1 Tax=unclassified Neisseria TaxID=2623750 RepID=UPI00266719FC|nr:MULTISPECIES: NF038104 family lipoprotein [unclassified Neisseria]MDO1509206.1 NF038104 family lipoprotein [Neisseria sp. MVDL19-042950]MDO1515515.1 NF038104 family lipoprotein [Neisseria sp. MVDL18-041461]MDO1562874.1 NF038104 family lipoprotein [Neisseria sp. MVDL20-010259]